MLLFYTQHAHFFSPSLSFSPPPLSACNVQVVALCMLFMLQPKRGFNSNPHLYHTHTHTHAPHPLSSSFSILLLHQVAELAGFWLLTLLQTPLTLYTLANTHTLPGPLEVALSLPLLLFLFSQLALGLWTLHRLVNSQALKFHLSQNSNLRHTPSSPSTSTTNGNVRTEGGREHIEMTKLG